MSHNLPEIFTQFSDSIEGEFFFDDFTRRLYATDASAYRELPLAVALPKSSGDIRRIISLAREIGSSIIPRTAGTSLAGQVVGSGIVVDVSKYFNRILEVNKEEHWVRLEPGVIRDELNMHLNPYGLLFGPETATANRAMVGGMVGNNSCGANSLIYGSTRDHLLSAKMILSDGQEVIFSDISNEELDRKRKGENVSGIREQEIYSELYSILIDEQNQREIENNFPKKSIKRRNTGYAIDLLLDTDPFRKNSIPFNVCRLIAGSEGTLGFITEIKFHVDALPPREKALICIHFNSLYELLEANLVALKYKPHASELIDHFILECTKGNIGQSKNRFFIKGDPAGILIVELASDKKEDIEKSISGLISELKANGYGYHYPVLYGEDMNRIWALRKAGLGLLSNIPGDAKPVPEIEDTAVDVEDLPAYIKEMDDILAGHGFQCVHYAHVGSGEIHVRPIINLKTGEGQELYRTVLQEVAVLVKKYNGSLSGEHGDGRLRGEFIPLMLGPANYKLLERVKNAFDPENIFNPGKIVNAPRMNTSLRYVAETEVPEINTYFDFSKNGGVLRAAELCNGSGDCRKTHLSGGTMCPSYMATRDEKDTTRARANILREYLTNSVKINRFDHPEIHQAMDLCLSCKGCKSECPSNVDMTKLKAEFLQHYYDDHGIPLRSNLIGNINSITRIFSVVPWLYNSLMSFKPTGNLLKNILGFSTARSLPSIHPFSLRSWYRNNYRHIRPASPVKTIFLFCDEFTNYHDVPAGLAAMHLLTGLKYDVVIPEHAESGRAYLSKGMLKKARGIAERNVRLLSGRVSEQSPMVGIEPSAILTFRDEYPGLVEDGLKKTAEKLAENVFTFEEFITKEFEAGNIRKESFTDRKQKIKMHVHCHQKALSSIDFTAKALSIPSNFEVQNIPSGCCGMAGSFGIEKEHHDLSMKIGNLVLFPAVKNSEPGTLIAAAGTSCRHQIMDGTSRAAHHPAEILWNAFIKKS
jgi:FAD/FMN-containing dehydrogenase/Fe-S oxidoreductase